MKVDNIEKVEEGLSRQKEALKKLNESYYNAKGTLDTYKDELKKNENNLKRLDRCFDICKTKMTKKVQNKYMMKQILQNKEYQY